MGVWFSALCLWETVCASVCLCVRCVFQSQCVMSVSIHVSLAVGDRDLLVIAQPTGGFNVWHRGLSLVGKEEQSNLLRPRNANRKGTGDRGNLVLSAPLTVLCFSWGAAPFSLQTCKHAHGPKAATPVIPFSCRAHCPWNSDSEKGITQCDWGGENSYRQGLLEGVEEMIINLGFTACFIIREVAGSSVHCLLAVLAACGRKIRNSGGFRPGFQTQLCYLVGV